MRTFEIGERNGELWIKCLRCGKVSFNTGDVLAHYCGSCHEWHEGTIHDPAMPTTPKAQP